MKHGIYFYRRNHSDNPQYSRAISVISKIALQLTGFNPIRSTLFNKIPVLRRLLREIAHKMPGTEPIEATLHLIRLASETFRPITEAFRPVTETIRLASETIGLTSETIHLSGETIGLSSETIRLSSEMIRLASEAIHLSSEAIRLSSETIRLSPETIPLSSETIPLASGRCLYTKSFRHCHARAPPTIRHR